MQPLRVRKGADAGQVPAVGFLNPAPSHMSRSPRIAAFIRGLPDTGYVDDRNVTIEYRWADGRNDRLAELAADLLSRKVAVLTRHDCYHGIGNSTVKQFTCAMPR